MYNLCKGTIFFANSQIYTKFSGSIASMPPRSLYALRCIPLCFNAALS